MLSLTHSPVTEFAWRGKIYKVDLSFNHVLLFLEMEQDDTLKPVEKFQQACKLFFHANPSLPSDPEFYNKAMEQISKEITDNPYGTKVKNTNGGVEATRQFDYKQDAGAIYASFFDQYGIDLLKERNKMHWTIFKALFDGLGPKTYFQRILQIRTQDPNQFKGKAQQQLLDAQNYYAVGGTKTQEDLTKAALNDQTLSSMFNSLYEDAKKGGKGK